MKISQGKKGPVFEPITFYITIESEDELLDLYHRSNMSPVAYREGSEGTLVPFPSTDVVNYSRRLWGFLQQLVRHRGLHI